MPRTKRTESTRSATPESTPPTPLGWSAWILAVGLWLFAATSLVSFNSADWPSHVVAVHNGEVSNLCGTAGAWVAFWSYRLVGLSAWLLLAGAGGWLVLRAAGYRPNSPLLRLAGLLVMVLAIASMQAVLLPTWGVMAGAPSGLLAHALADAIVPLFSTVGSVLVLLALFLVGAVIAADEFVMSLPRHLMTALSSRGNRKRGTGMLAALWSRPEHERPALAGGPGTAVLEADEEEAEYEACEDEYEDDGDYEDEEEEEEEEEEADEDEDDGEYEYEDEYEDEEEEYEDEEEEEEEAATPKLSMAELRAKIAKLPLRMNARKTELATDDDIQREDYEGYTFPSVELLAEPEDDYSKQAEATVRRQAESLVKSLDVYGIEGSVVGIDSGPTVTLFSVELEPGTKVSKLNAISRDLARSLRAQNIRIVPTMAGKTAVGIEVPNEKREKVRLRELISSGAADGMTLPMFLGKDASGEPLVADLVKMPHMLIAGTTGSGKSVCINTIIMSWLFMKRPDELKLILVDPKMVELSQFSEIPHLASPVISETGKAAGSLAWAVTKMEERYELLREAGVRDLPSYNNIPWEEKKEIFQPDNELDEAKIPRKLPYIVFVIDELADLMMSAKEVEQHIVRIAQKARAVGIHLILATQRPQANVVTGLIKANMPCRMSFKVASGMDSRIVLDAKGAELLLGHGDLMMVTPQIPEPCRMQGTLVDDAETRKVVRFLRDVAGPTFERSLVQVRPGGEGSLDDPKERDPLFDDAVRIIIESGRGSVSLVQRRLSIGYSRASRLVDQMAMAGILGEHKGSVAREVLISLEDWDRMQALESGEEQANELEVVYDDDPDGLDGPVPDEEDGDYLR
ncbi:MAG: DNA translocase FtsK 4TM domain-containing protein [Phycisphaerales bacterium]|nr:DNA translocase FtsK 4TM domain-containing protein [Phycisphaerales bacterium]